ncbi:MAG: hypothetical protein J0L73_13375 [Verrucomicrobia bacterium]|nr:hypothetical protein [Verrucomicrobiota bacterium]
MRDAKDTFASLKVQVAKIAVASVLGPEGEARNRLLSAAARAFAHRRVVRRADRCIVVAVPKGGWDVEWGNGLAEISSGRPSADHAVMNHALSSVADLPRSSAVARPRGQAPSISSGPCTSTSLSMVA